MVQKKYSSFSTFWPDYVREHQDPTNRKLHFIGTALALATLGHVVYHRQAKLAPAIPLVGYLFAWAGHFLVEKNRPATFKHPFKSLRGDFKMFGLIARGKMAQELKLILGE